MGRLLEALNSKEVDLCDYELFVLILGYNDLELDWQFFEIYYKHILDTLQLQSPFGKFIILNLVTDMELYKKSVHGKNSTIKMIKGLSSRIFLFNLWKKFIAHNMVQPEFIRKNRLTPMGACLMVKSLGHKISCEVELWYVSFTLLYISYVTYQLTALLVYCVSSMGMSIWHYLCL